MRKKILLFSSIVLLMSVGVKAAFIESYNSFTSCFTATNDTTVYISSTIPSTVLAQVNVSSRSAAGTLTLYDSRGTATNPIGTIELGTIASYRYEVILSSGLTYTTLGNTSGVTIIYKKVR